MELLLRIEFGDMLHSNCKRYDYYIIEKQSATVTGPLTKEEFVQRDEIGKYKVKWSFVERTSKEKRKSSRNLGIFLLLLFFFVFVLPWLILLLIIIFVVRLFIKKKRAKQTRSLY